MSDARDRLRDLMETPRPVVPTLDRLDSAVLPQVFTPMQEVLEPVREGKLDNSGRLDQLTDLALDNLEQILAPPVDLDDSKQINAKIAASTQVLNIQSKVDDTRLRKKQQDLLPKLLEILKRERANLPPRLEAAE